MSDTIIVVPTYNEKDNIRKLIEEIFRYAPGSDVLVVDDNSPDGTGIIVDRIAAGDKRVSVLHRMSGKGRGLAGIAGFKEAISKEGIRYVMEMDADLSHDPIYISDFLEKIKDNDIVIGSRFISGGGDTERNFFRRLLSRSVNYLIKNYFGLNVNDCSSGYRCFKKEVLASIKYGSLISKGPAIVEEILYISYLKKYRIAEIPIVFKKRHKNKTKLNFIKLFRVGLDILSFKKTHLYTL